MHIFPCLQPPAKVESCDKISSSSCNLDQLIPIIRPKIQLFRLSTTTQKWKSVFSVYAKLPKKHLSKKSKKLYIMLFNFVLILFKNGVLRTKAQMLCTPQVRWVFCSCSVLEHDGSLYTFTKGFSAYYMHCHVF